MLESLNYVALSYLGHVRIVPLVCHTVVAASQNTESVLFARDLAQIAAKSRRKICGVPDLWRA
jgi:hypothetical protein